MTRSRTRRGMEWALRNTNRAAALVCAAGVGLLLVARLSADEGLLVPSVPAIGDSSHAQGGTAGGTGARYLLVSSFQCFVSGCQYDNAVLRYDADTSAFLGVHVAGVPGPTGMAVHPVSGNLLVACRETSEVREYSADDGTYLRTLIAQYSGGLSAPASLLFRANGNLLVTSAQSLSCPACVTGVLEFDGNTGEFLGVFVNGGELGLNCGAPRCLFGPNGMAFGPNGNLYVASTANDLVIEYNGGTGAYVGYFDTSILDYPTGLEVRPNGGLRPGNILVTSRYMSPSNPNDTHKVIEFDKMTRELITTGGGVFASGFQDPGPLMWDDNGNLLIADRKLWDVGPDFSDKVLRLNANSGAFAGYATAIHDDHLHYANGMVRVTVGCGSDAECDDANPCTDDHCNLATLGCEHVNDNANDPNDGLFCNGLETGCVNGVVQRDPPPACGDGLPCTFDSCNESTDSCDHQVLSLSCLIDGACYANGALNPMNQCLVCSTLTSQTTWSNVVQGVACGSPVVTGCDLADSCNGMGQCQSNFRMMGTPCGSDENDACTDPDTCDGSGACASNHAAEGSTCDDGLGCTQTDQCAGGVCVGRDDPCTEPAAPVCLEQGGTPTCVECAVDGDCADDGLACTRAVCSLGTNTCTQVPDDSLCSDGAFCNGAETCDGLTGECVAGVMPCAPPSLCDENGDRCVQCLGDGDCDDGLFCTGFEFCDDGTCAAGDPPSNCCKSDVDCDNNSACDGFETCVDHACLLGEPLDCSDGNKCTQDVCDPINGCSNPSFPSGTSCGDSTESLCNHADTCNGKGVCSSNVEPDGTPCSDGVFCNGEEMCAAGVCLPGEIVPNCCDNDDECNNGNICDGLERCIGRVCVDATPLDCSDDDPCTTNGCHPVFGCQISAAPVGTPCGNPNGTACDLPDACDGEGGCAANRLPNGTPCPDGVACNGEETCQNFVCAPGIPPAGCCKSDEECDNLNVCDGLEHCAANTCVSGEPLDCEDGNPCTSNVCDPALGCLPATLNLPGTPCGNQGDTFCDDPDTCTAEGVCQTNHANDGTPCPDGSFCNGAESCLNGVCAPGTPIPDCCRSDEECDNHNVCDGSETCFDSTCAPGTSLNCDDGNPCTDDVCDPIEGCGHVNNSASCNDGDVCTGADLCVNGACVGGGGPPACVGEGCTDCNENNVRDDCETLPDCDNDGTADACEPRGDMDGDCDVDLRDLASFQSCFTGASNVAGPPCLSGDVDADDDIDLSDFASVSSGIDGP